MSSRFAMPAVALIGLLGIGLPLTTADSAQDGSTDGHLVGAGAFGDLVLVASLPVTDVADLVADVAVSPDGQWAFLASRGPTGCASPGEKPDGKAGAWIVDISDLENPALQGFIGMPKDSGPSEGMQVVSLTTRFFSGDVLVMNSEPCGPRGKGGIVLWDVTDPTRPLRLSANFGDRGHAGVHSTHSAFAWDAGEKAYAVVVDNVEFPDVDVLDITNPRHPVLIAELNLNDFDVDQPDIGLDQSFLHDMTVKEIDGRWTMLLSYWDGGFVLLDVTDPVNPVFLGDTDYSAIDPLLFERTGMALAPEGNAHQAEFTADNRFFIGTDEDFTPFVNGPFSITTGLHAGQYPSTSVRGAAPVSALPDRSLNGPTVYVGYACADSAPVPPAPSWPLQPGEEMIAVAQRGPVSDPGAPEDACFPGQKADQAVAAGYDAVVFVQHHVGHASSPTVPFCGSGGFTQPVVAVCTTHDAYHHLFDRAPAFDVPYDPAKEPTIGAAGHQVRIEALFDGWGYVHLFDASTMQAVDQFAIPEAHEPDFAFGFGDLTVHEVATHPTDPSVAFLAYYSGGVRVMEVVCQDDEDSSTCELWETGGYLDPEGNDFWGVEAFVRDGASYLIASDRDHGLWIFTVDDS